MSRFILALLALSLFSGCCSLCGTCRHCAKDDDDCFCCSDGSESPKYRPPGPWWTRPDCGCPCKCASYQEQRQYQKDDAAYLGALRGYR